MARRMIVIHYLIRKRQISRVKYARLCTKELQQSGGFLDNQPRIGSRS